MDMFAQEEDPIVREINRLNERANAAIYAQTLAKMSDTEFEQLRPGNADQVAAYNAEYRKRQQARDQKQRQQAIAREQQASLTRQKDAMPFTDQLAQEIVERISSGELLTLICLDPHMPTVRRCNMWLKQHHDFKILYDEALQDRLAIFEEDVIRIVDQAARDFDVVTIKGQTRRVLDPARVTVAKLQSEVRFKHLKAGRPQKWGETSTLITRSDDPFDVSQMSADDLEKLLSDLDARDAILKASKVA
jgi:predicted membrane-bound spermidine synthase